ncbi:MAG: metallophosphoesterase [candidate division Zixibacteria bacterium]|nr:metallophosphoesterase [candidate division Zixibacteria bacterium]
MKLLFVGEVVGKRGKTILQKNLSRIRNELELDFVIVNGNKIDNGFSVNSEDVEDLERAGVDVITLGDNCFKKRATVELLDSYDFVLRPANAFIGNPGRGFTIRETSSNIPVCVISVFGRTNFKNPMLNDPFMAAKGIIKQHEDSAKIIIVDFHANATSEKLCLGYFLSGRVSAVIGTHFSVQTADLNLDDNGTAYISDVGILGSKYSVVGYRPEGIIESYMTSLFPRKKVAENDYIFNSLLLDIDPETGRTRTVSCFNRDVDKNDRIEI